MNTYERRMHDDISTVELLDSYEKSQKDILKLTNVIRLRLFTNKRIDDYELSILIERPSYRTKYIPSNIRMTDIKQIHKQKIIFPETIEPDIGKMQFSNIPKMEMPGYHFLCYIKEPLVKQMKIIMDAEEGVEVEYTFGTPIQLNAQNSKNRTGYGNEYDGGFLVYEGTLYGETSLYVITGFALKNL
jgi:hypothetical protein